MNSSTSYIKPKDMSIKALEKLLLEEEFKEQPPLLDDWSTLLQEQRNIIAESPHLPDEMLNEYRPSNAYLLEKRYPTKQTRLVLDKSSGLPPKEVGLILLSAMIPHIICMGIIVWIALVGF